MNLKDLKQKSPTELLTQAEDLGIETLTQRELEQILGKWKPRKEEEK